MTHTHNIYIGIGKFRLALITMLAFFAFGVLTLRAQNRSTANEEQQQLKTIQNINTSLTDKQRQLKEKLESTISSEMERRATTSRDASGSEGNDKTSAGGPKLQISLLTCGPGNEVYEYYGHSAIRVLRTDSAGLDLTFNYGVFSFNTSNFALKFAMGKTDYMCVGQPTADFIDSYRACGRYIDEQILNTTQTEAQKIYQALMENIKPENCTYRYNFLYDNCATRVRDIIEKNLNSKLQYPERPTERSFRDAIHFFCRNAQWSIFGQDLLLGSEADVPATGRELEFAPLILEQDMDQTIVMDQSFMVHNFVLKKQRILDPAPNAVTPGSPVSPSALATILLLAGIALAFWEIRNKRIVWMGDTALMLVQGVAGIIVTFVFFFSTHPTVGSNWLVWILNPLPFIGLYWQIKGARTRHYQQYHIVAAPIIALFLIFAKAMPQHFGVAIILLALLMLVRSVTNIVVWLKIRKTTKPSTTYSR